MFQLFQFFKKISFSQCFRFGTARSYSIIVLIISRKRPVENPHTDEAYFGTALSMYRRMSVMRCRHTGGVPILVYITAYLFLSYIQYKKRWVASHANFLNIPGELLPLTHLIHT